MTAEQLRAQFALCKVKSVEPRDAKARGKFRTQLLKLPARLHTNGLGQTAAYLLAQKPDSPEREIYGWLAHWLAQTKRYDSRDLIQEIVGEGAGSDLASQQAVAAKYRPASAEARAVSTWLKRFAEAFLADPDTPAPAPAATEDAAS